MTFAPDGRTFVSGGEAGVVRLWDAAELRLKNILRGHGNEVWCAAYSPDGKLLATGGKDQNVMLWPAEPREMRDTLPDDRNTRPIFSPDGTTLVSTGEDNLIHVRTKDAADNSWKLDRTLFLPAPARRLEWSPDGKTLVVGFPSFHFMVYETATWEIAQKLSFEYIPNALRFSPDGKTVATGSTDGVGYSIRMVVSGLASYPNPVRWEMQEASVSAEASSLLRLRLALPRPISSGPSPTSEHHPMLTVSMSRAALAPRLVPAEA